jgi:hypothetical protein
MRRYWVGSSASSLCTFLPIPSRVTGRSASFAQDYRSKDGDGFPEFTRCFNHSFPWKLQTEVNLSVSSLLQPAALPTELPGNVVQFKRWHSSIVTAHDIEHF